MSAVSQAGLNTGTEACLTEQTLPTSDTSHPPDTSACQSNSKARLLDTDIAHQEGHPRPPKQLSIDLKTSQNTLASTDTSQSGKDHSNHNSASILSRSSSKEGEESANEHKGESNSPKENVPNCRPPEGASAKQLEDFEQEMLRKMEEANREIAMSPSAVLTTDPTELELLARLDAANRLLEADKRTCKGLTPTHSRTGSSAGPGVAQGHSRKGSSTSQISVNSTTSQQHEEDPGAGNNLWEIWGKLVNDWASARKKPAFIKQLVRKGIPHPFRGLAWQLLLDVNNSPMKTMYVEYLKQKSPSEKMIRRDIARTFPEHDFFKEKDGLGQESLFHVMKAYSLHDREVGYCQGSGFIVGLLLMQMPEEEAFAVLVKLMQDYRLRELFTPSMAELSLCMYKLECLIQELLPDLYTHFQSQSVHTSMYASPWFLTLFATVLPLRIACRVMDLFISEGMDVIFRLGIAILQSSQHELLSQDMEAMLQFFQKDVAAVFERDEDTLFNMASQVRFSAKRLKRLEKEYTALKSKENEDQIELRRLRTENRLLRQRIDNLEKESASLADRLIQYQLTRAQEAEETYALKNELSLTKQKFDTSQKQLKEKENLLGDIKERTDSIHSASSLDEEEAPAVIKSLQEELIMVRLREAEHTSTIKTLNTKILELQQCNTRLQEAPSNDVQCLQEELIAVKLREAEANLSLKEMRQSISDLENNWQRHLSSSSDSSPREKSSSKSELRAEVKKAQEDLMTSKLKEAGALSHLKDAKQKIMELETQNQICTNQIRRMDEENKRLKSHVDNNTKSADDAQKQIKNLLRKIDDLESKHREELMMARIRDAENDSVIGELRQQIAHMEIQKEELLAADSLENKGGLQDLHNNIFDLQEEVLQLKMSAKSPNTSVSKASVSSGVEEEEDYNEDAEDEDLENPETLNRTLTEIIEGKRSSSTLIAILNRENSDCDTSSASSESSSGHKLVKTNSFKGERIEERDCEHEQESSHMVEIDLSDREQEEPLNNANNCDSADITDNTSAIHQSNNAGVNQSSGKSSTQSSGQTGSVFEAVKSVNNHAMSMNQSPVDKLSNGNLTSHDRDTNENLRSKSAKPTNSLDDIHSEQVST